MKRLVLVVALGLLASACSKKSGGGGPTLSLTGPATIATFTCNKFSIVSSTATTAAATVTLGGLGSGAAYATLAACRAGTRTGTTTFTIAAGATSVDGYFRTSSGGSLTVTASAVGFAQASATLTVNLFQALGQSDTSTVQNLVKGMNYTGSPCIAGGKLFLPEYSNNRVLAWNSIPTSTATPPDFVLGQPNLSSYTQNTGGIGAASTNGPFACTSIGTKFFVDDYGNSRILAWNTIPTTTQQAADYVLGQPNFTSGTSNGGGAASASTMAYPCHVFTDGTRLFVADTTNNRVLVWNTVPTATGTAADFALGQPDLTSVASNNGGISGSSAYLPYAVASDGTHLFVYDYFNYRILGWNAMPSTNGAAANFALGQPNLTSATANNGGVSAHSLNYGKGLFVSGTKLIAADSGNNRVLVWDPLPSANAADATLVLGQANFTTNNTNQGGTAPTAQTMAYPTGVAVSGSKLFVAETTNNRLLVWNTFPTTNDQAADLVLGQQTFTSGLRNEPGVGASTLNYPTAVFGDGTRLFVADILRNRVLIWNTYPVSNGAPADVVVGQADFSSFLPNRGTTVSAGGLNSPSGVFSDGTKLYIVDSNNNRVLGWNAIPTANGQAADFALGQPDLTTATANTGGISGSTLNSPWSVFGDGTRLFVSDSSNHRVLVWSAMPTSNGQAASFAVGEPDLTTHTAALTQSGLQTPKGIFSDGTNLFIADQAHSRVLGWSPLPTTSGQAATLVLGEPDFTTASGGHTAQTMVNPFDVKSDGTRLFVADYSNSRVLVWSTIPTTNGQAATSVIGQPDFTSNSANNASAVSASTLQYPKSIWPDFNRLFIADYYNDRILIVPNP